MIERRARFSTEMGLAIAKGAIFLFTPFTEKPISASVKPFWVFGCSGLPQTCDTEPLTCSAPLLTCNRLILRTQSCIRTCSFRPIPYSIRAAMSQSDPFSPIASPPASTSVLLSSAAAGQSQRAPVPQGFPPFLRLIEAPLTNMKAPIKFRTGRRRIP